MEKKYWKDELSPLQKKVLQLSNLVGVLLFFVGVQFIVRGKNTFGGILAGFGMFLAVQVQWGIATVFEWLEKQKLVEKYGYSKLFWWAIITAYLVDGIGIGLLWYFLDI